jgi:hypothetical protein
MNKGLHLSGGDYVWFLNAGDLPFSPTVLFPLANAESPDVIFGDTALCDSVGRIIKIATAPPVLAERMLLRGMLVSHQSFVVRKALTMPYDLSFGLVADNAWVQSCLASASTQAHVGIVSRYLVGGLSERRYFRCLIDKMRLSVRLARFPKSVVFLAIDALGALRFYGGKQLRRFRTRQ